MFIHISDYMNSTFAAKTEGNVVSIHPVRVRARLAEFHERDGHGHNLTSAAELLARLHDETKDPHCLQRIEFLARKAQLLERPDVAEAIYLILHSRTKDDKYRVSALAAGERARDMHP
jgi:hypothetical protein